MLVGCDQSRTTGSHGSWNGVPVRRTSRDRRHEGAQPLGAQVLQAGVEDPVVRQQLAGTAVRRDDALVVGTHDELDPRRGVEGAQDGRLVDVAVGCHRSLLSRWEQSGRANPGEAQVR